MLSLSYALLKLYLCKILLFLIRILANRVSAARSKERKAQYTAELEHKVPFLQIEATTLLAQLRHLQRDSMGLHNKNSELRFRLQAMEQQLQLRTVYALVLVWFCIYGLMMSVKLIIRIGINDPYSRMTNLM
ncbi:hypothetical protein Bca4012_053364 [Brassica carinata]